MDAELVVAKKYGLYWTWSYVEDDLAESIADGFYIYHPEQYWEPFWMLFDRLGQLNDYCFNQLLASEARLCELQAEHDSAIEKKAGGAEIFDYLSETIPAWEDNVAVFAKASPIILLASFTEWGLKHISKSLFGAVPKKTERGKSDIQFYLEHLVRSGLDVSNTDDLLSGVGSFRSIRNNFAHGKWSEVAIDLHEFGLREAFTSVSDMFEAIESAAWRKEGGLA